MHPAKAQTARRKDDCSPKLGETNRQVRNQPSYDRKKKSGDQLKNNAVTHTTLLPLCCPPAKFVYCRISDTAGQGRAGKGIACSVVQCHTQPIA